ncbi:M15 family metallopeptidase [Nocardioides sp. T2.26MG-1]|uniref:M15 family metallopeptidase n=1 Tax=Nocardioides sp. T2.26MG-1 TaxID=3041166 RepID=UPI002477A706|nr:M15 family metallopeptidase [Nocardioides sp. T2.26MG-1]CAI9418923.1 Putative carboxypeptidase YodJ [Nocardioides sp. T2.26MG-1]
MGNTKLAAAAVATVGAVVGAGLLVQSLSDGAALPTPPPDPPAAGSAGRGHHRCPPDDGGFDTGAHSTTDPGSIWVVVNKTHPVDPSDFRPEIALVRGYQVATAAAEPLEQLLAAADREGLGFKIASAFRSYDYQLAVHAAHVAERGQAEADRVSARAGYSEHQTGLAVDLVTPADPGCDFDECFADTPGGRWLAAEAWRYGFIVRYQAGGTDVTGYAPEPWHLRFVGTELAAELHRTGVTTLEEFFGVPGGDYLS